MSTPRRLFGTDGIRGKANHPPITPDVMTQLAIAISKKFAHPDHRSTVVIGKDTRLSCYMIETALAAGFVSMGMDVSFLGPIPTPGVAMLTRSMRAHVGVMISASHNPYSDNGIKLFGPDGHKLTDEEEAEIESLLSLPQEKAILPQKMGKIHTLKDATGRYIEFVKATLPKKMRLDGVKIVIDCAHGAAYKVAPQILWELGATVIELGVDPDGVNINAGCGATSPTLMAETVVKSKAHLGISLDGDADRLIMADEKGKIVSGDQLMAVLALSMRNKGKLAHQTVVATHMSNGGFERFLKQRDINLVRTAVGDRYVIEEMEKQGYTLGGEQSGHLILSQHSSTGDGLLSALQILGIYTEQNKPFSTLTSLFTPLPQLLRNIHVKETTLLKNPQIICAIEEAETTLKKNQGRLFIRFSGTEPLLRLMGEANSYSLLKKTIDTLEHKIQLIF